MKTSLNSNRHRQGVVLWVVIIVFVIFIVIVGGIALTLVKAAQRIVPPPQDPDGIVHMPGIGSGYSGGVVIGYQPGGKSSYEPVPTNRPEGSWSLMIYADDSPTCVDWTNCILVTNYVNWDDFVNGISNLQITNLMQLDPALATNAPCRFYKPVVQQW